MATNLDVRFEEALAKDASLPGVPRRSDAVARELERRPEPARVAAPAVAVRRAPAGGVDDARCRRAPVSRSRACKTPALPDLGAAPDFTDTQRWFNTPGGRPADARRAARPRRAGRLLDLHVHQLHPHAAVPEGPVRHLPPVRPRDRRRRDARVHLRAGGGQRPAGDPLRRDPLPGRPGQPVRHLERLPEPVLAGRVPDRRPAGNVRHTQFGEGDYKQSEAAVRAAALRRRASTTCRRR